MLPDYALSTVNLPTILLGARSKSIGLRNDYEDGPISIGNASSGINYQEWHGRITDTGISIGALNVPDVEIIHASNIYEFSFTFDQNGRLTIVYVIEGVAYLWWYDSNVGNMTTTNLGSTFKNPRVSLDDKRSKSNSSSDIILAYLRNYNLYYRQQRDRYTLEYLLASNVYNDTNGIQSNYLIKIGMGRNLRFQFVLSNLIL